MQKETSGSALRKGGGRLAAGLLWALLRREGRDRAASSLTLDEITDLNRSMDEFRTARGAARRGALEAVQGVIVPTPARGPLYFSALLLMLSGMALLIFSVLNPERPIESIFSLFSPLFVATLSPAALLLLPVVKRRRLFFPRYSFSVLILATFSFVALLWLLFWINGETLPGPVPFLDLTLLGTGALFAPLFEEIVFREVIPSAAGRPPYAAGHVVSIVLFALLHLPQSFETFVYYLLAAATLALLRILTDGLFWPVLVHGLANGISLLIISG